MNVASLNNVRENYELRYDDGLDEFTLVNRKDKDVTISVPKVNGVYSIPLDANSRATSVDERLKILAIGHRNSSETLYNLHQRLLHSNCQNMQRSLKLGHYKDVVVDRSFETEDWKSVTNCLNCSLNKDGRIIEQQRGSTYAKRKFIDRDTQSGEKGYTPNLQSSNAYRYSLPY